MGMLYDDNLTDGCYFRVAIFEAAKRITPNIAYYVPRNVNRSQMRRLDRVCDIEENYLHNSLKAVTVYYSELATAYDDYDDGDYYEQ